jgi:hypothetical protein
MEGDSQPLREIDTLREVVRRARLDGFTVMSDFCQRHMALVAMAASMQLITTRVEANTYGRVWRVTNKGLRWLEEETR